MHNTIRTMLAGAVLAGSLVHGPLAQAGPTLSLEFSEDRDELFAANWDSMRIDFDNGHTSKNARVKAGMFSGNVTGAEDFDPATLYLDEDNVLVYCVDILQDLRKENTVYSVNDIRLDSVVTDVGVRRDFGRMLTFLGAVNDVLATDYRLGFGDRNWLNPQGWWMSGAIQVGIWESLYEEEGKRLSIENSGGEWGSWFSATRVRTRGVRLLDAAFARMDTATPLDVDLVKWLESDLGQDLIADPVDVPAPAPIGLLAVGFGLLALRRPLLSRQPGRD